MGVVLVMCIPIMCCVRSCLEGLLETTAVGNSKIGNKFSFFAVIFHFFRWSSNWFVLRWSISATGDGYPSVLDGILKGPGETNTRTESSKYALSFYDT